MAVSPQHFVQARGLRLHYRLRGEGEPLLLLHGWGGSSLSFMQAASLLEKRFRLLAPDLPGFGFSEGPPEAWGSAEYADAVAQLARDTGFERLSVVGHSFGGKVGLALATAQPQLVSRLVLVASPVVRLPDSGVRTRRVLYAAARRLAVLLPPLRERILGWARDRFGSSDYRSAGPLRSTLIRAVNEDWRPTLASLEAPLLLLWGEDDAEVPLRQAEAIREELPSAELKLIERAGHFPFLDDAEAFAEAVSAFLLPDESAADA